MRNTLSSPDRPKVRSPKTSKAKRKRRAENAAENSSSEEPDSHQNIVMSDSQEEAPLSKSTTALPKIEVSLPGPELHPSPCDFKETQARSAKPLSKIKSPPSRASSVVSLKDSTRHRSPPVRSVRAKSSDGTSPASKTNHSSTPHQDANETSSIAESSGNRIRRSEPERLQYFKEQSTCDDVEPHRAHCKRCDRWISLGTRCNYAVYPWESHRRRCDQWTVLKDHSGETERENPEGDVLVSESIMDVTKRASPQSASGEAEAEVGKQEPEEDILLSESNPDISQPSPKTVRRNDAERKAFLEADPRAQEVRPHEVLCRSCQKWIQLGTRPYLLSNWNSHQQRCSGVVLSRVATTERKISLLNDPQVKTSSSRNVECAFCRTNVELDGVAQYDLTNWYEHKAKCSSPTVQPTPKAPVSRRSRVFSTPSDQSVVHTPTSRVHTSATSLNSTPINHESLPRVGEKRTRDEEEIIDRPVNRPRTETYQAPKHEAPGPWGWFMQPLKAFVRGFREGLGTPST